jgi:hypothetical protein
MAGLVPAIHPFLRVREGVDGRDNPRTKSGDGHDEFNVAALIAPDYRIAPAQPRKMLYCFRPAVTEHAQNNPRSGIHLA